MQSYSQTSSKSSSTAPASSTLVRSSHIHPHPSILTKITGSWLRFSDFHIPELNIVPWRLIVFIILLLMLRRFPPLLLLYKFIPDVRNIREALFSGHFGPMGAVSPPINLI